MEQGRKISIRERKKATGYERLLQKASPGLANLLRFHSLSEILNIYESNYAKP
jgi:hypothetical protein